MLSYMPTHRILMVIHDHNIFKNIMRINEHHVEIIKDNYLNTIAFYSVLNESRWFDKKIYLDMRQFSSFPMKN